MEAVERVREEEVDAPSVSGRAVAEATRSLAALLAAGLPLSRAIETTRDVAGGPLGPILDQVLADVRRGATFADALAAHPDVFPALYVGVVRAGERSGRLSSIVDRLAGELERQEELRQRIVSATLYPLALVALGGVSVVVLLFFVVPRFAELLVDAGADLPWMTAALLAASEALRARWPYVLAASVVTVGAGVGYLGSEAGKRKLASVALDLPVVGPIRRSLLAGRFARLLGVLLEGGAPLVTALDDTAASLADPVAEAEVGRIRSDVRVGTSLHRTVADSPIFPVELARLVAVGEESGRLAEFLGRAADLFERRSVRAVERLVTLLEPATIVLFGGVVAVVALALLQAVYGVNAGSFR